MTHRAEQVLVACKEIISDRVKGSGAKAFTHKRLSLDPEQDELPAYSVDYGEDRRTDVRFMGQIDSLLSVEITKIAKSTDETLLRQALLEMRAEEHRALMANPRLGLDFVVTTSYGGAAAPEILTDGELLVGSLMSTWLVHYEMALADPS